uniref:PIN domain-containing protein n=1 Tax=Candidatus Kentrum sp. LPFa TaxID=2126335 RepID=A0A450XXP4_9GAMM|nr:MAG: hypothetical protein BECKLPF1236A_GA0070988_102551 [Candidatus Kentron sp. LPFa]VFK34042.1 MAG: hypothetical protein BECKLPF1236C_GA0070990_102401 [Candidatus Kentron sp. LPFa]
MKTVYVETSIISYLVARPSRDIIAAGHQQITHEWWATERNDFSLYVSALVLREASGGDPVAASTRLQWLQGIPVVAITPKVEALSEHLILRSASRKSRGRRIAHSDRRISSTWFSAYLELQAHRERHPASTH